jgi:hypothetical protein
MTDSRLASIRIDPALRPEHDGLVDVECRRGNAIVRSARVRVSGWSCAIGGDNRRCCRKSRLA